ncbi:MAG: GSCFA domain-containing protein, partial [Mangrovicoccus sp.]
MKHPYIGLPDQQFWKKSTGLTDHTSFDPVGDVPFRIGSNDRVVTAGSCFAQHVARYISDAGFYHYITETAHPLVPEAVAQLQNYGMFSARYGNVYTARQLKQLLLRAYGEYKPETTHWLAKNGKSIVDPFRPQIQPGGFASVEELEADQEQHFEAVRAAIEGADVFVFTLGLTECWIDKKDGAALPLAPGVAGGTYAPDRYGFHNFDEVETSDDLHFALKFIREINPKVKFILTVSPVPLNATMEPRHVFESTTWSKAVLRIAAEKMRRQMPDCAYFPSYEIITSPHVRGRYFAADARSVLPAGVNHVMGLFSKHYFEEETLHGIPQETMDET